jgi:hypothetical protein
MLLDKPNEIKELDPLAAQKSKIKPIKLEKFTVTESGEFLSDSIAFLSLSEQHQDDARANLVKYVFS